MEPMVIKDKSDEMLMELVSAGNHAAFSELVTRYSGRLYRVAYRMLFNKNDAEDVVQEVFLKIWHKSWQWDKSKNLKFSSWLYRVLVNLCIDYNKKKKPLLLAETMDSSDDEPLVDRMVENEQKEQMLKKCLLELPERQRAALTLCFYEGLSNKEAAEIMNIKLRALQSLLMRAKDGLRNKIRGGKLT